MKQTKGLKLNVLLTAICLLLVFVCLLINYSGAWLTSKDTVKFTAQVDAINIVLKQDARELTSANNNIYLGTNIIEADKDYDVNITITNNEQNEGYYVRYKVVAQVNGTVYNINNYITFGSGLNKNADGWIYVASGTTPKAMTSGQILTIMDSFKIPATASNGQLSISTLQGKFYRLYLYVQGSPLSTFDA